MLGLSQEAAKEWQKRTEAEFRLWADRKQNCDAIGKNTFDELQQLALVSWLMSGDVFPVFKRYPATPINPYSLRIHLVEADRISTPDRMGGGVGWPGIMSVIWLFCRWSTMSSWVICRLPPPLR